MSEKHLNYKVEVALDICTNKSQQQLLASLKSGTQAIEDNWDITCGEITVKNVELCDCDCYEE
ncbi:MAG: hypothetical protein IKU37_08760 [Candidatus Gastranaerophilales bacterium]|nr:hypothetical protein [Candidatus Gastranaerophilales bacterium]